MRVLSNLSPLLNQFRNRGRSAPGSNPSVSAPSYNEPYQVSTTTDVEKLARRIRTELQNGPVLITGEYSRIKAIYVALVGQMTLSERDMLARLRVPLSEGRASLTGLPATRIQRRLRRSKSDTSFPLEHLLLTGDLPGAEKILDALFPGRIRPAKSGLVKFNDSKGNLSIGQYRDILAVTHKNSEDPRAAHLSYVVERWADHNTFRPQVQLPRGSNVVTIDVAQLEGTAQFGDELAETVAKALSGESQVALDKDFVPYDQTCVWNFNGAFWRYLGIWERVSGKSYQRALPKGKSESHHAEFYAEAARVFASHVTELQREGALAETDELWFHEKATGSGEFTAGLLDEIKEHHPDYYSRMRVVLSDVSEQVLALARHELEKRGHLKHDIDGGPEIFFRNLSAGSEPFVKKDGGATVDLRGRFLYFRHANFFDQLPSRLFAKAGGKFHEIYVRAVIAPARLATLEKRYELTLAQLTGVIDGSIDLNQWPPDQQERMINFWSAVWSAVKFEESYRPIEDFAAYYQFGSELVRELEGLDDIHFVTSDRAIKTLMEDIELLDPEYGYACFTDIFLQRVNEFRERWIELAKYDNGVWVGTNGILMAALLARNGYESSYYPVELTLGEPTPVYTLTINRRDLTAFVLSADVLQQLTSIERAALRDIPLVGLPRRMRNNLRELPARLRRIRRGQDWSWRLANALDLTGLLREFYYRSTPSEISTESPFLKLVVLLAEVLCEQEDGEIDLQPDIDVEELKDLEDFLAHRPLKDVPLDLIEPAVAADGIPEMRLRLPTLARKLEAGEFVVMAEVDLPHAQSLEQLRRRIFQFQGHVDAISITSGRLADPRFLRSGELLQSPLLESLQPDRLIVTVEMRDRRAEDLERDLRAFESRGVHNFFILTGDFERNSKWWMDSLHGIQIAERMRNGDGVATAPSYMRSRMLVAGAMAWSGIPDTRSRVERDVVLKLRAGVDLLLTQPIYDLPLAMRALDMVAELGLDRRVHIVPELFPIRTMEQMRSLSQAPGIVVPSEMEAAYRRLNSNVAEFYKNDAAAAKDDRQGRFSELIFRGVNAIRGYENLFEPDFANRIYREVRRAEDGVRRKAPTGREAAETLRAARAAVLSEVSFQMTQHAMDVLCRHSTVSGFLIVARNGRELRKLSAEARRLRKEALQ